MAVTVTIRDLKNLIADKEDGETVVIEGVSIKEEIIGKVTKTITKESIKLILSVEYVNNIIIRALCGDEGKVVFEDDATVTIIP